MHRKNAEVSAGWLHSWLSQLAVSAGCFAVYRQSRRRPRSPSMADEAAHLKNSELDFRVWVGMGIFRIVDTPHKSLNRNLWNRRQIHFSTAHPLRN